MSHHPRGGGGGDRGRANDGDPRRRAPTGASGREPPNHGTLTQPGPQQQQQQQQQGYGPSQQQQLYGLPPIGGPTYPAPWEQGATSLTSMYSGGDDSSDRDGGAKRPHTSRSRSKSSNSASSEERIPVFESLELYGPRKRGRKRPKPSADQQPSYEQQPSDLQGYDQPLSSHYQPVGPGQRRVGPPITEYGQSGVPPPQQPYGSLSQYDYGDPTSAASDYAMRGERPLQRSDTDPMPPPQMPMQSGLDRSDAYPSYQPTVPGDTTTFGFHGGVPQTAPSLGMSSVLQPSGNPSHGYQPPPFFQTPPPAQNPTACLQQGPYQQLGSSQIQIHGGGTPGGNKRTRHPQLYCQQPSCQHLPIFGSKQELAEHMYETHRDVKFNCDRCDNDFDTKLSLAEHKKYVNHGPGYYCRGWNCAHGNSATSSWQTTVPRDAHLRSSHTFCPVRQCDSRTASFSSKSARNKHMVFVHKWDARTVEQRLATDPP